MARPRGARFPIPVCSAPSIPGCCCSKIPKAVVICIFSTVSGRWYRAPSLNGPWQFVPAHQLPRDFANIPDQSPKENVKASIPGTSQAEEALIANSTPQSAAVARTNQMAPPQLDGAAQLAPIDGTPLHYVVNSATPIIEVDPQSWYACQNGIWYVGSSANGPWMVAAFVPPVIYTIPPGSPLHFLTYVRVYGATPDVVYEGYTPGYLGTEVASDGTVVYGTGYDYAPWIGSVWYGPPMTWGWGFDDCWTPWWGWGFGCGFGWGWGWGFGWGYSPPYPRWGGFRHWHDHDGHPDDWRHGEYGPDNRAFAHTSLDLYAQARSSATGGSDLARHDIANGYGRAYNSRTGELQAGPPARVQSVSQWDLGREYSWPRNDGSRFYRSLNSFGQRTYNSRPYARAGYGAQWHGYGGYQAYSRGNWSGAYHWSGSSENGGSPHFGGAAHAGGGRGFHGGGGFHGGRGGGRR
jgi:uncharacterized membrane protein YgcG